MQSAAYRESNSIERPSQKLFWILLPITLVILGVSAASFITLVMANPHGYYDAFAIWNLHARMIFRGGEHWQTAFSPHLYHADYPLLVPITIAKTWGLLNAETLRTPMVIAGMFLYAAAGSLFIFLHKVRNTTAALLALSVFLGTSWVIESTSYLYADIQFAFYLMIVCILVYLYANSNKQSGYLILAGMAAGFSAWTKNEGILVLFVLGVVYLITIVVRKSPGIIIFREVGLIIAGLFLPICALAYFKLHLAPQNDLVAGINYQNTIGHITDAQRYAKIFSAIIKAVIKSWKLPILLSIILLIIFQGLDKSRFQSDKGIQLLIIILFGMFLGYFGTYLLTHWNIEAHVRTSANRLILHLYPTILLLIFTTLNSVGIPSINHPGTQILEDAPHAADH